MHHNLNAFIRNAEQVVRLDQLQALVHERGAVDRDLAAHLPGRVGQRLLAGHLAQLRGGHAPEGAAAGGEHQPVDRAHALRGDQLMERRMLRVHGDQVGARGLGQRGHQLAAHHEALLVGQSQVQALAQRGDRRPQTGGAHERVQHQVAVPARDQLHQPLRAGQDLSPGPGLGGPGGGVGIGQGDAGHAVRLGLLDQGLPAGRRGQAHHLQRGTPLHHVESLGPDRPGGPDYRYPAHPPESRRGGPGLRGLGRAPVCRPIAAGRRRNATRNPAPAPRNTPWGC